MSPYELVYPGGSVEHHNEEAGQVWLKRLLAHSPHAVWIQPLPGSALGLQRSPARIHQLMVGRMCPLTVEGLERGSGCWKQRSGPASPFTLQGLYVHPKKAQHSGQAPGWEPSCHGDRQVRPQTAGPRTTRRGLVNDVSG